MNLTMSNYLVVSALGADQTGIVTELTGLAADSGCSIADSRMAILGSEFALIMMLRGEWNALAKFEHNLPALAQKLGLATLLKRTSEAPVKVTLVPYDIHIVGLDNPGIVCEMANFFSAQAINIVNLETDNYAAPYTGAPMVRLFMTVNIPKEIHIADLREQFLLFCDDLNLDAIMEPAKGP